VYLVPFSKFMDVLVLRRSIRRPWSSQSYRVGDFISNSLLTQFSVSHLNSGKVAVLDLSPIDDLSAGWENLLQVSFFNLVVFIIYFYRSHNSIQVVLLLRLSNSSISLSTFVGGSTQSYTWITMQGDSSWHSLSKLRKFLVLMQHWHVGRRLDFGRVPL